MVSDYFREKLKKREGEGTLRSLVFFDNSSKIDFVSNDYLGLAKNKISISGVRTGATGSRLISGNYEEIEELENFIANFHKGRSALLFPSGLQANISIFPTITTKDDLILYDELVHFSLKQGIRLSFAKKVPFKHNDVSDLRKKLNKLRNKYRNVFIVVETIYSMDGDTPNFRELVNIKEEFDCELVVDEAHSGGIFGEKGEGLIPFLNLHEYVLIRTYTYGKAFGFQGAALVFNTDVLKKFFINFSYNFIYTTGISPVFVRILYKQYKAVQDSNGRRQKLFHLTEFFKSAIAGSVKYSIVGGGPIFGIIIPDIKNLNDLSYKLQSNGILVKPIFYPTVKKGSERVRIVLHSFNTEGDILLLKKLLTNTT